MEVIPYKNPLEIINQIIQTVMYMIMTVRFWLNMILKYLATAIAIFRARTFSKFCLIHFINWKSSKQYFSHQNANATRIIKSVFHISFLVFAIGMIIFDGGFLYNRIVGHLNMIKLMLYPNWISEFRVILSILMNWYDNYRNVFMFCLIKIIILGYLWEHYCYEFKSCANYHNHSFIHLFNASIPFLQ